MMIGRYEVVRKLGEGGMARVLLARAPGGSHVVLKVPFARGTDFAERVRDEARVGLRLTHPHVVETLDLFEHEGRPILVVQYVPGASLQHLRKAVGPLPAALVARLGSQVAEALRAIHEAKDEAGRPLGILHRDVTPGNILVTREGDAKLIDLGIAKSAESRALPTAVGTVRGTLRYLAPELLQGAPHAAATDLWSLGVVLLEAVLGRRAVEGSDREVLAAIAKGAVARLRPGEVIPPPLDEALDALLAPAQARLQAARAAASVLARVARALGDGAAEAAAPVDRVVALLGARAEERDHDVADAPTRVRGDRARAAPRSVTFEPVPLSAAAGAFAEPTPMTAPAARPPQKSAPSPEERLRATLESAPTEQMPAVSLPAVPEEGLRPVALDDELGAPDTIQMTAAELSARGLEVMPARTEQMPAVELERLHGRPAAARPPAPSLVDPAPSLVDPAPSLVDPAPSLVAAPLVAPPPSLVEPAPPGLPEVTPAVVVEGRSDDALLSAELAWRPGRGRWLIAAGLLAVAGALVAAFSLGLLGGA